MTCDGVWMILSMFEMSILHAQACYAFHSSLHTRANTRAVLNQFLMKLDARYERSKKPGTNSTIKRERIIGMHSTSRPPSALPSWMVNPDFKLPPSSVCLDPSEGDDAASSKLLLLLLWGRG